MTNQNWIVPFPAARAKCFMPGVLHAKSKQRRKIRWHDPWPYDSFALCILKTAYEQFAGRVGEVGAPRASNRELVRAALNRLVGQFTIGELECRCPGVRRDTIRLLLRQRQGDGMLARQGRGSTGRRRKKGQLPPGRGNGEGNSPRYFPFAHESRSVTVRLNTGAPGLESMRSATK